MNILDWSVIGIFSLFMIHGFTMGFIKSVFGLLSTVISVASSLFACPIVSKALINTEVYVRIKQSVKGFIGLENFVQAQTTDMQIEFINSMNLPEFLQRSAMSNNNPIVYNILDVSRFEDYICGYFATIIINIISIIVVFIVVKSALKAIELTLNAVSKLPLLNLVNRMAGLTIGTIQATVLVWVLLAASTLFLFSQNIEFMSLLHSSLIAHSFCENNPIMKFITDIKPF